MSDKAGVPENLPSQKRDFPQKAPQQFNERTVNPLVRSEAQQRLASARHFPFPQSIDIYDFKGIDEYKQRILATGGVRVLEKNWYIQVPTIPLDDEGFRAILPVEDTTPYRERGFDPILHLLTETEPMIDKFGDAPHVETRRPWRFGIEANSAHNYAVLRKALSENMLRGANIVNAISGVQRLAIGYQQAGDKTMRDALLQASKVLTYMYNGDNGRYYEDSPMEERVVVVRAVNRMLGDVLRSVCKDAVPYSPVETL